MKQHVIFSSRYRRKFMVAIIIIYLTALYNISTVVHYNLRISFLVLGFHTTFSQGRNLDGMFFDKFCKLNWRTISSICYLVFRLLIFVSYILVEFFPFSLTLFLFFTYSLCVEGKKSNKSIP